MTPGAPQSDLYKDPNTQYKGACPRDESAPSAKREKQQLTSRRTGRSLTVLPDSAPSARSAGRDARPSTQKLEHAVSVKSTKMEVSSVGEDVFAVPAITRRSTSTGEEQEERHTTGACASTKKCGTTMTLNTSRK